MAPLRHGVVTPNCKQTSWDHWFVAQELKFKVSERSELNWNKYRELIKMEGRARQRWAWVVQTGYFRPPYHVNSNLTGYYTGGRIAQGIGFSELVVVQMTE